MADKKASGSSADLSASTSNEDSSSSVVTHSQVQRMMMDLDASFTKKLESLGSLLKRKITAQSDDEEDPQTPKKKQKTSKTEDVLTADAPDLDNLEDNLADTLAEKSGDETDDEDLLGTIAAELSSEEKLGDKLDEKLAAIVNGRFQQKMNPDLQKAKFEAHNRPENCAGLVVPKVNPEIWNNLSSESMKSDLKLQHIQRTIVKAATASARAAEIILKMPKSDKAATAVRNCTDAIAMCGHASREISLKRRQAIRPHLNKQITRICDETVPITSQLFGDNLATTLKEVKEADKIGAASRDERKRYFGTAGRSNYRSQYYNDNRGGHRAFLGRGRTNHHQFKRQWNTQKKRGRGRHSSTFSLSQ